MGSQHGIGAGQPINLVGVDQGLGVAPAQGELRVMSLGFADRACPVDPLERLLEIREGPGFQQVVAVHHLPARQFEHQGIKLCLAEGGGAISTGDAGFLGKGHRPNLDATIP